MKPAEDIKRYFQKSTLSTNPDVHEIIFEKVLRAQDQSRRTEPASYRLNIWSNVMKNTKIRIAVAAVVVVACGAGLFMWGGTSNIALADVLSRIQQVSVYMYHMSIDMTIQMPDDKVRPIETQATVMISQEHGMRMSMEMLDPNSGEITLQEHYMLPPSQEN